MSDAKNNQKPSSQAPLRMSERLNLVLGARIDLAMVSLKSADKVTVNACTAKMVLVALGEYHGQDGRCYPGIAALALCVCANRRTIMRAIETLEALGLVSITQRHHLKGQSLMERTNWYVLHWDAIAALNVKEPAAGDQVTDCHQLETVGSNGSGDKLSPDQVTDCHLSKCQTVTRSGDSLTPKTLNPTAHHSHPGRDGNANAQPKPASTSESGGGSRGGSGMGTMGGEHGQGQPGEIPIYRLLVTRCRIPEGAAKTLQDVYFGAELAGLDILRACGFDELEARRQAAYLKRGRIVSVFKGVVNKLRRNEPVGDFVALMQTWLSDKSKPEDFTEDGAHLATLGKLRKHKSPQQRRSA